MVRARLVPGLARQNFKTATRSHALRRLILSSAVVVFSATSASADTVFVDDLDSDGRRPAVAAANVRVATDYSYFHRARTRESFDPTPSTTATLRAGGADFHAARAEVAATVPLAHSLGLRGRARGSYNIGRRDLELFGANTDDLDSASYGVAGEIFLRDPALGTIMMGSSYDRVDREDGIDSHEIGATAGAAIFFPDLGVGAVDWFVRFDFIHRDTSSPVANTALGSDLYKVAGGAGWYLTDASKLVLGARWVWADHESVAEQDIEGFMDFHWLIEAPIPVELVIGGSVGVSEYKEEPFPSTDRLIYGGKVGLVFRFRSGATLLDMAREYD